MALVDPPIASCVIMALTNEPAESNREGFRSVQASSTASRPVATASRECSATTAGMELAPGRVNPRASAMQAMVEAVPMVMQVPAERAMQFSISFHSPSHRFPAQRSAQYFQASVPLPKVVSRQWALSIGPAGRKTLGISALRAPMSIAGTVLSHPPIKTAASMGWHRRTSSVSIASRLR